MRADRRGALLDFLLEAAAHEGTTLFPRARPGWPATGGPVRDGLVLRVESAGIPGVLAGRRRAGVDPAGLAGISAGPAVRSAPLRGTARGPLPNYEWVGQPLMISDFLSDREFRGGGLYAELCKPLGVRAVLKVFLPTGGATGGVLVFDTTRSRFTETDRLAVQRIVPHLAQLRRNAHARRTYPAPIDTTAAARTNLLRLTPRERVVLARAAAGETNTAIAQALFVSPGTVRKHLEHIYDKLEVRTRTQAAAIYTDDHLPACLGQSPANDPHRGRASLAPRQAPL